MKINRSLVICVLIASAALSGCATGSRPDAMVATPVAPVHKSTSDISVAVSGGKETSKMGASQISNEAFGQALHASIENSGLFSKVSASDSRYKLSAFIGQVDQPTFGFSMTVTMEVSYTLTDTRSSKAVWSKNVRSTHKTGAGEAFAGVTRLRMANEGAARDNIAEAISNISALKLL